MFSDPAAGLERCIREAKVAVKGIKLHIALTHLGQCIISVMHHPGGAMVPWVVILNPK